MVSQGRKRAAEDAQDFPSTKRARTRRGGQELGRKRACTTEDAQDFPKTKRARRGGQELGRVKRGDIRRGRVNVLQVIARLSRSVRPMDDLQEVIAFTEANI